MAARRNVAAALIAAAAAAATLTGAPTASAAESHLVVRQSGDRGWTFNPDPAAGTPYELSSAQASSGVGSLYVPPITNTRNGDADHFVAQLDGGFLTSDFWYFAVDVKPVATPGTTLSRSHFYTQVDVNLPASTTSYDCRYTLPSPGAPDPTWWSAGAGFSKAESAFSLPGVLTDRPDDGYTCPLNPFSTNMPTGSTVRRITFNVGDTSSADTGVGAYIDNAFLGLTSSGTRDDRYYDFEPMPDTDGDGLTDDVDPDAVIALLPSTAAAYSKTTSRKVFSNELAKIEQLLHEGNDTTAVDKLTALRRKVDGCGSATRPNADRDDWIIDCAAQSTVRDAIDRLIAAIES